jgi:coproporphyrinogen III oxidase
MSRADAVAEMLYAKQETIVAALARVEGRETLDVSTWERLGMGGGKTCVVEGGAVFERAATNVSLVSGAHVPSAITEGHLRPDRVGKPFRATGISMILHPRNPYAPSFHANFRYFEVGEPGEEEWWFGGGLDLTPMYGFDEDAVHFHRTLRTWCDRHEGASYPDWKSACDKYFYLEHRDEMRGVGGVFFDYLTDASADGFERCMSCAADGVDTILPSYLPIVERRTDMPYGERERSWQLLRRGRYVEFNLIYDRGTLFGLQTKVNIDSVLMSMPPHARWAFEFRPEPGSPEADVARFVRPHDWAGSEVGARAG